MFEHDLQLNDPSWHLLKLFMWQVDIYFQLPKMVDSSTDAVHTASNLRWHSSVPNFYVLMHIYAFPLTVYYTMMTLE